MKNERFINSLKNGGITVVIIYSIFSIILEFIFYAISGKNVTTNSISGLSGGKLAVLIIILMVVYLILDAGLYGSSNDVIEGKQISFRTFLQNAKKYFWSTLGYSFIYFVPVIIVMIIFSYFAPFITTSVIGNLLFIAAFQAIFIPLIILHVTGKDTKGYIRKNYVILTIFSLITCSMSLIPIVGQLFYIILNGFYTLLVISMCDDSTVAKK